MRFEVLLTGDATQALEEIHDYIGERDDPDKAILACLEPTIERRVFANIAKCFSNPTG